MQIFKHLDMHFILPPSLLTSVNSGEPAVLTHEENFVQNVYTTALHLFKNLTVRRTLRDLANIMSPSHFRASWHRDADSFARTQRLVSTPTCTALMRLLQRICEAGNPAGQNEGPSINQGTICSCKTRSRISCMRKQRVLVSVTFPLHYPILHWPSGRHLCVGLLDRVSAVHSPAVAETC